MRATPSSSLSTAAVPDLRLDSIAACDREVVAVWVHAYRLETARRRRLEWLVRETNERPRVIANAIEVGRRRPMYRLRLTTPFETIDALRVTRVLIDNPCGPVLAGVLSGARVLLVRAECDYQAVIVADHEMSEIEAGRDAREFFGTRQIYRIRKEHGAWMATALSPPALQPA